MGNGLLNPTRSLRMGGIALIAVACNALVSIASPADLATISPASTSGTIQSASATPTSGQPGNPVQAAIPLEGSLQNPAWSPEGDELVFTFFHDGYNLGPADIMIFNLKDQTIRTLIADGSANVNLPGSAWNPATHQIVFSSSRDPHDEIFIIPDQGRPGDEIQITDREEKVAYEPSFSPDGVWIVFESHPLDVEDNGVITVYKVDGSEPYRELTGPKDDCREPNFSPAGHSIVYQSFHGGQWDLWVVDAFGADPVKITGGAGDKTDASFSPDGRWIVYSTDDPEEDGADLFLVSVSGGEPLRATDVSGYAGAPSFSPDGRLIAYEYYPGDPDDSPGTSIWITAAPLL
jgi:TolB protein